MCDDKGFINIDERNVSIENSDKIYKFMQKKKLCDVEIITGQNKYYYHSNILAVNSEYFENIFCDEQRDEPMKKVTLNDEDAGSVIRVIHYFYTGKIEIEKKNIIKVMSVASRFMSNAITDECCRILANIIDETNCLELYESPMLEPCVELGDKTMDFIKENFKTVSKTPKFLEISSDLITDLISSNNLDVTSEDDVYDAVKRWIMHDKNERKSYAQKLFEEVKLPLVSSEILLKEMEKKEFCDDDSDCRNLFLSAIKYKRNSNSENEIDSKLITPRLPVSTILIAGGWNKGTQNRGDFNPVETIEYYDPTQKKWTKFMNIDIKRRGCALGYLGDEIIFAGGNDIAVDTVETINLITKKKKIRSSMLEKRLFSVSIGNFDKFYVVGGCSSFPFNIKVSKTVEEWNSKTDSWKYVADMITPRYACGGTKFGNEFFVIGGCTNQNATNINEAYCFTTNKWRSCAPMNNERYGPGVASDGKYIYAIGGGLNSSTNTANSFKFFNIGHITSSVERYDPKYDTWTTIANVSGNRYFSGAGVLSGNIISMGGANGGTAMNIVEYYDDKTGTWKKIESMTLVRERMGVLNVPMKYFEN